MKRVRAGTLTVGMTAILFGLLTACVLRHYFGPPTPVVPKSAQDCSPSAAGGEDRPPELSRPSTAAGQGVPTLAPPRERQDLAAGGRLEPAPHGQVILVHVEAQQADPKRN